MSEKPKGLEISPRLEERLRKKFVDQLTELARPFLDWNLDENQPSPESKKELQALTNNELLARVKTEGYHRKHLVELAERVTRGSIEMSELMKEDEMTDHVVCFHFINELAVIKLNAASLFKSTEKKDSDEILPDENGVRVAIEHYVQERLLIREDIDRNGSSELQEIVGTADSDPEESRRIQWQAPSLAPEQVTLVPPGNDPKKVHQTGPTQAVPVIPPISPTGFSDVSAPIPSGHEPTMSVQAFVKEIGTDPTVAMPVMGQGPQPQQIPQTSPAASSSYPPAASLSANSESAETPDDIMPVVFFTDATGNPTSTDMPFIPLFQKRSPEEGKGYIFSVGTDPTCDIRLERSEYPYICPHHADIRIEGDKTFIKSKEGASRIVGRGKPIIREWEELKPGEVIKLLPQLSNGVSPHSIRREINFRIEPTYGLYEGESREGLRRTMHQKAKELLAYRSKVMEQKNDGPTHAMALRVSEILRDLMEFDMEHKIGALTQELQQKILDHFREYNRSVAKLIDEVREAVLNAQVLEIGLDEKEQFEKSQKERRKAAMEARRQKEGVKVLHIDDDEDPETVDHVFKYPVYYLRPYMADSIKIGATPMISPKITLGSNKVCHEELEPSDKTSSRKHKIAQFMAQLILNQEGEKYSYQVKYLHENVRIRTVAAELVAPPRETFTVNPGTSVEIGHYTLTVDEELHGFSYKKIKDHLDKIIEEHFERIENQTVTTSEQDEEAYRFLRTTLEEVQRSNLPEELKKEIIERAEARIESIFNDLWNNICEWDEQNPQPDSGYFQTILMLIQLGKEKRALATNSAVLMSHEHVQNAALIRAEVYARAAKSGEKNVSRVTRALSRFSRRDDTAKAQHEHDERVAGGGIVELARFIEFGLVTMDQISLYGAPSAYCQKIQEVLDIRSHVQRFDEGEDASLEELLQLHNMGQGKSMNDVFAPEEIETRNLHIEVNLNPNDSLQCYIKKVAVFEARKTFKRMDTNKSADQLAQDTKLINGLAEAGIIQILQLIDDQGDVEALQNAEDILERKTRQVATKKEAAAQKELVQRVEEEEIDRLVKYAAAVHDSLVKSRQGMTIDGFVAMFNVAHIALDTRLQKFMSRRDYDIFIDSKECIVRTDSSRTGATETSINWKRYFHEWEQRFQQMAGHFARKACRAHKESAQYATLIAKAVKKGVLKYEDIGVTEHELARGIEASRLMYTPGTIFPLENLDYLTFKAHSNHSPEDQQYWEAISADITRAKLDQMFQEWRTGKNKLFFERKIRKLQRRDTRAIEMFDQLNATDEERDLLQLK